MNDMPEMNGKPMLAHVWVVYEVKILKVRIFYLPILK